MKARCQVLDHRGLRCETTKDVKLVHYHGDNELYAYPCKVQWVAVFMCKPHRTSADASVYSEREIKHRDRIDVAGA